MKPLIPFSVLIIAIHSSTANADLAARCNQFYSEAGAVPFTESCARIVATAPVDLGTYQCRSRAEFRNNYCNPLPPYVERDDDEDESTGGDGGDTGGSSGGDTGGAGNGSGGDGGGTGGGTSGSGIGDGGSDGTTTGSSDQGGENDPLPPYEGPEIIVGSGTTSGDGSGGENLPAFNENTAGIAGGNCTANDQTIPWNGGVDFTFTQGFQFADEWLPANYSNITAGITAYNLAVAGREANETGDSSELFQQTYDLLFPLFPHDPDAGINNPIGAAFQEFSEFADTGRGC